MPSAEILDTLANGNTPLRLHVLGVAGSGMSGLAGLLLQLGHAVGGSDKVSSDETRRLQSLGLEFTSPHTAAAAAGRDAVIYSSAIKPGNVTYDAALHSGVPLIRRAEALAAIMHRRKSVVIAGTHGKTTTSAMAAHLLRAAGLRPGHYVGAEIPLLGTNACWDDAGKWFVAEGDESDGTLVQFHPHHTILLNVEADHLDYYRDLAAIHAVFNTLCTQTAGSVIWCADDPGAAAVAAAFPRAVSYGFAPEAMVRAAECEGSRFRAEAHGADLGWFDLALPGRHNIANALAVITLGVALGIDAAVMRDALATFRGARRRFETRYQSARFHLVDDYGHHPTEIRATLAAARERSDGRVLCLFQPHRYSRTVKLRDEFATAFADSEMLWITRVYPAGEPQPPGVEGTVLVDAIRETGASLPAARFIPDLAGARLAAGNAMRPGDLLLTLGAGNVHECAAPIARDLAALDALIDASGDPELVARIYEPMRRHTTMLVGGCAQFWVEPASFDSLAGVVRHARAHDIPLRVIGRGSNLIVRDGGIPGIVIHPVRGEFTEIKALPDGTLRAGAGVRFKALAAAAREAGIGGFEWMEGVPGLVGGSLRMNAGAMGTQTFDQAVSLLVLTRDGHIEERPAESFGAQYRHVAALDEEIALAATFKGTGPATAAEIDAGLEASRVKRRTTQPVAASAGCVFKNPPGHQAGRLIDATGLKNTRIGGARVSDIHGNFIINDQNATARDVLMLIEKVRQQIKSTHNITLETEVQIIGQEELLF